MKHHQFFYVLLACLLCFLAACLPEEPILIYVTPTPAELTEVPTLQPVTEIANLATPIPSDFPVPGTPAPTNTILGSVIAADYTLPPTSTPRPSETPLPSTATFAETATLLPVAPSATTAPAVPFIQLPNLDAARMGIQLDPTLKQDDWNQAVADIQRLGVKWLKVQVAWKMLQPNNPGEVSEDFRRLETYLETAHNNGAGLNILLSIAKAPNWARDTADQDGPPKNPQMLVDFVNLVLQEFGQAVDAIEVWNEPNLIREWSGQPLTGQSYMSLFVPVYNAINVYSARMKTDPLTPRATPITVITAGLAPSNAPGATDDRLYLQQMYDGGLAGYGDLGVGVHPYGWGNPPDALCCQSDSTRGWDDQPQFFFMNTLQDYRGIMLQNNHGQAKLWPTEFGWASWAGFPGDPPEPWVGYTDECQQGTYTVRAFQIGQGLDYIGPMMLWNLNWALLAGMVENRDERAAYSVIVPLDPRERAAYWMLYDAIRPEIPSLPSYSRCPGAGG